jgi:anti-sigma factor RsiW
MLLFSKAKMKVSELKAELETRGGDTSGLKADLLERLQGLVDSKDAAAKANEAEEFSAKPRLPKSAAKLKSAAKVAKATEEEEEEGAEPTAPKSATKAPKSAAKAPKSTAKAPKSATKTPAKKPAPAAAAASPVAAAAAPVAAAVAAEFHYEFGGPIGAVGVMVGLPVVIYGLFFACG